jgi:hypothetical protein
MFLHYHPNLSEVNALSAELQSRGYSVDVFDYRSRRSLAGYDLIVGFGEAVHTAQLTGADNVVLYATGASANFQHRAVEIALTGLLDRFGREAVKYVRIPERYLGISEAMSSRILSIGNEWTASTFAEPSRILSLPGIVPGKHALPDEVLRLSASRGRDIAWVGSKGVLHKGLHLAADVAAMMKVKLHAIGIKDDERDFAAMVLQRSGCSYAIYPFMVPGEAAWNAAIEKCRLVLGVSLSEGMSTSVLTAVRSGLFPVSTESCGISVGEVVPTNASSIAEVADKILTMPRAEFEDALTPALRQVSDGNTIDAFSRRLHEAFDAIRIAQ